MKKLLVLVLVLGMASMAQAAFQLSVDGQTGIDEITLLPSQGFELDVHIDPGTVFNGGNLDIVLSNNQGSLDYADISFPAATIRSVMMGIWILEDDKGFAGGYAVTPALSSPQNVLITGGDITWNAENNATVEGPWGGGFIPEVSAESYSVLMEGLMFHCEEDTDVIISLVAAGAGITMLEHDEAGGVIGQPVIIEAGTVIDTIMVRQIPEPMTMSLLALGGLGLLRRRRA